MDNPRNGSLSQMVDGAVVVATLTFASYCLAFAYDFGFANALGLPSEIIRPDIASETLVLAEMIESVVIPCFLIAVVLLVLIRYLHRKKSGGTDIPIPLVVLWANSGLLIWMYGSHFRETVPGLFLLTGATAAEYYFASKRKKAEEAVHDLIPISPQVGLAVFVGITFVYLSFHFGRASAMSRVEYAVVKAKPPLVVLRRSGDDLICGEFDSQSRRLGTSIRILRISEAMPVELSVQSIGPLIR